MVAYCAYYSRKFEPRLCERVTPETAPQLHMLAQALGLMDLKKASEALCGDQLTNDAEEQIGCGERKRNIAVCVCAQNEPNSADSATSST